RWVRREEVPEELLANERELIAAQARNEGKPDKAIDKIVEGRINAFYQDNVLYDQAFMNSEKFDGTVGEMVEGLAAQMGENITVSRIARIGVGEAE
ncbi:MAG TPA: elongation factor Ts, partial [Acidimicrobiia bacterium]